MSKVHGFWKRKQRGQLITRLMSRDGLDCAVCQLPLDRRLKDFLHKSYITFDHIIPRSHGGLDIISNLRLAHRFCNNLRGNDPISVSEEGLDEFE